MVLHNIMIVCVLHYIVMMLVSAFNLVVHHFLCHCVVVVVVVTRINKTERYMVTLCSLLENYCGKCQLGKIFDLMKISIQWSCKMRW